MKKNKSVEQNLRNAVSASVPDVLDDILSKCQERKGKVISMDEIKAALKDVKLLVTAKIGGCPQDTLKEVGVVSIEKYAKKPIAEAVMSATKEYFGHESEEG